MLKIPFFEPKLETTLKLALKKDLIFSTKTSSIVENCKLIFVTVGTPQLENGSIDLSMIKSVIQEIGKLLAKTKNEPIIIIKSTVVPGTTKNIILPTLEKKSGKKSWVFRIFCGAFMLRSSSILSQKRLRNPLSEAI